MTIVAPIITPLASFLEIICQLNHLLQDDSARTNACSDDVYTVSIVVDVSVVVTATVVVLLMSTVDVDASVPDVVSATLVEEDGILLVVSSTVNRGVDLIVFNGMVKVVVNCQIAVGILVLETI